VLNLTAGLAPVLCLLSLLLLMDSFKLVPMRLVMQALAGGAAAALAALALHLLMIDSLGVPIAVVSRLTAPVVEELLKLGFVIYAVRSRRVGFPVDAAIVGFAVGTGFALVENSYYLLTLRSPSVLLWLVRGFGAAILHGAMTAIAAIIAQELAARRHGQGFRIFVPGALAAIAIHGIYNQFVFPPVVATLLLLIVLPPVLLGVFTRSERATREWMSDGLDLDVELLKLVLSEEFGTSFAPASPARWSPICSA
jgi:protease PrsW